MTDDLSQFPPGTMLSQLVIDIYANQETNEITVLYDRPLAEELLGAEYNPSNKNLDFIFAPGRVPFGMPLKDDLDPHIKECKEITLLQMDMKTNKPVAGLKIPLIITGQNMRPEYPADTILAEMKIDLYSSEDRNDVWILHDKPFEPELRWLEIDPDKRRLYFVFLDDSQEYIRKDLGSEIREALLAPFQAVDEITLYQVDLETKMPVHRFTVSIANIDSERSAALEKGKKDEPLSDQFSSADD